MQQQEQKTPMTSCELSEKTAKLIASVKSLEEIYDEFMADKEIADDGKLMDYQTEFWNENVAAIINEITQTEANDKIVDRCRLLWDNCFFTRFYNEKILGDWPTTELELRKLTILLGIYNLKKLTKLKEQPIDIAAKSNDEEPDDVTNEIIDSDFEPRVSDVEADSEAEDIDTPTNAEADEIIDLAYDEVLPSISDAEPDSEEEDLNTPEHVEADEEIDLTDITHEDVWSSESDYEPEDENYDTEVKRRKDKHDYGILSPKRRF